jgi:hypothetical protein
VRANGEREKAPGPAPTKAGSPGISTASAPVTKVRISRIRHEPSAALLAAAAPAPIPPSEPDKNAASRGLAVVALLGKSTLVRAEWRWAVGRADRLGPPTIATT